jgi:hypothetical protein
LIFQVEILNNCYSAHKQSVAKKTLNQVKLDEGSGLPGYQQFDAVHVEIEQNPYNVTIYIDGVFSGMIDIIIY